MGPKIIWNHCNSIPCLLSVCWGKFGQWQIGRELDELIFIYELISICRDVSVGEMLLCSYHGCCLKIHQAQCNNYINHPEILAGHHTSWSHSMLQNDYLNLLPLERTVHSHTWPNIQVRAEKLCNVSSVNSAVKWLYLKLASWGSYNFWQGSKNK